MKLNENPRYDRVTSDRVLALSASCIRVATQRALGAAISQGDALDFARAYGLDVSAAIAAIRRHLRAGARMQDNQLAIEEAKIITLSPGKGAIETVIRMRLETIRRERERSATLDGAREGQRVAATFKEDFQKWSKLLTRFWEQLEEIHRKAKRQLHYLNLDQNDSRLAADELEQILAEATRKALQLIGISESLESRSSAVAAELGDSAAV